MTEIKATTQRRVARDVVLVGVLALGVRLVGLGSPPDVDELNHLLAARSLLAHGTLQIANAGPYTRARLFTYLVAGLMRVFGDSLVVARLPSVAAGVLLAIALYVWVESRAGRLAGWVTALLFALYPAGIYHSQLARFYELHALLVWLGAVAVFRLASPPSASLASSSGASAAASPIAAPPRPRAHTTWLVVGAVVAFALALHLQVLTVFALGGLALWMAFAVGPGLVRRVMATPRRWWVVGGASAMVLAVIAIAVGTGLVARGVHLFEYADAWAADNAHNLRFYHWALLGDYGALWTLFPVLLLVAAAARPRATMFCATIFGVGFVLQSLAAWKHVRYFQWAMPFFFAAVGLAVPEVVAWIRRAFERVRDRLPGVRAAPWLAAPWRAVIATVIVIFLIAGDGAFATTARMLLPDRGGPDDPRPFRGKSDWGAAAATLRPLADTVAVFVSSSDLKPLYYLWRVDYVLQRDHLYSLAGWAPEFANYDKIDRPVISTAASVSQLVSCFPDGLVVVEDGQWRQPWGVPAATADFIESHLTRVPLTPAWRLKAFTWRTPGAELRAPCVAPHPAPLDRPARVFSRRASGP